ncbi:MAG TPA: type II secretion system F family protein [Ktedonobacterales bacterium]
MPPMFTALLPAVAGFLTFFAVLMLFGGLGSVTRRNPVNQRLEDVTRRVQTLEEIELQAPFRERFFRPMATRIARIMARIAPSGAQENTQRRLLNAGLAGRMQTSDFMGMKVMATLAGAGIAVLAQIALRPDTTVAIGIFAFFIGLGYYGPELWLRDEIKKRKTAITNALPDMVDLLTISVEAGLGFDQALQRIVSKSDNVLSYEFARVLQEMRVGISRRDALHSLAERSGVDDVKVFVTAIVQAEQLGASVGNVLRIQASEMRTRRRQRAEILAHQAPIKMLFPMAFLIFPPIFIVVLGPAIPKIVHVFAPGVPL